MTPEDIEKAEVAADGLYDRKRGLVAIIIIADLNTQEMRVIGRAPNAEVIKGCLATSLIEASVTGRWHATIESDE